MIAWLTEEYLLDLWGGFNLFRYITLRSMLAALTSLVLVIGLGQLFIGFLKRHGIGQVVRSEGPERHYPKSGTPTMGGALIVAVVLFSCFLWGSASSGPSWIALFVFAGLAVVGAIDDVLKIALGRSAALGIRVKFALQSAVVVVAILWYWQATGATPEVEVLVPILKDISIALPWFLFLPFAYVVVVGSCNAVNLTDGLDGLAVLPCAMVAGCLGIFAYVSGHIEFSRYLDFSYIEGAGELTVFCSALGGACIAFLWFNYYPATVFMGDVGALALGGSLGMVAVLVRQELLLAVAGGLFVLEALSVIIQVGGFKMTGRRIFLMAPLHHHFELKGWAEPKIVVRFWILSFCFVLLALATLKIR